MATGWTIPGADGEPILGDTHLPAGEPPGAPGVVVIAHGFKGYKDYGMFPRIAADMADHGLIAHRFNFSHSGMTANIATFERPDLFERDTWNKEVDDLRAVIEAVNAGVIEGRGLPIVVLGHSRGGVTALLAAGRGAGDAAMIQPAGVITASAPSFCNPLTPEQQEELLSKGFLVSPSSRTGQALRIGRAFLAEQLEEPEAHDLLALAERIRCPVLVIHGRDDPTVPAKCATQIAEALGDRARVEIIPGADHVYNTTNPMPPGAAPSPQLARLLNAAGDFALACCES